MDSLVEAAKLVCFEVGRLVQYGVVGMAREKHLECVRLVVPEGNADDVDVAGEVGDFRLQLGKRCKCTNNKSTKHITNTLGESAISPYWDVAE